MKRVLFSADDFGLSLAVNEGVERAHRDGLLSTASLMVAGDAAADAVARARRLPDLRVGLHLVTIEGPSVLPPADIPLLVDGRGQFPSDQLLLGLRYFFCPAVRRQLAREIEAQFTAFAGTGLRLDHANAHKHMHLHPTVGAMLIRAGMRHGLPALRVPTEPPGPLGFPETPGARALRHWTRLLRSQARRAGLAVNDQCFGLAWSGHMTPDRVRTLIARLPDGFSEIYFHPAAGRDPLLDRLMPEYEHEAELAALCDPALPAALHAAGAVRAFWDDFR
jgi:hopanoid biosynthesis associated protein HpnK